MLTYNLSVCAKQVEQLLGKLFPPKIGFQPLIHLLNQPTREKLPSTFPYSLCPFHSKADQSSKGESPSSSLLHGSPCSTANSSSGHPSSVFEKDTERLKCSSLLQLSFSAATIFSTLYIPYFMYLLHQVITSAIKLMHCASQSS